MSILDVISSTGILPVIKIEELETAVPLADALRKGGVNALEITARSEVAFDAIRAIKTAFPDMVVGAGTILTTELVDVAISAGAEYIVSPGYNPTTAEYCAQKGILFVPGCTTASDMEKAVEAGLRVLKFFPAEANGGVDALKLFAGPFPQVKFIPTGGINFSNLGSYLQLDCVAACGGSYMAKSDVIQAGNWEQITADCKKAVAISMGFELAHVGLNHKDEDEALKNAGALNGLFPLGIKNGNSSVFCGKAVEFMKFPFYGSNGHIGFYTNSVARAKAWFAQNRIPIREDSVRIKNGKMESFYLQEEIGGFAVHVVKR